MSDKIITVLLYVISHYKDKPISLVRLSYIIFLAEWYSAIVRNETLTHSKWYRRNFGPYSEDVTEELFHCSDIIIERGTSDTDGLVMAVSIKNQNLDSSVLEDDDVTILNLAMRHASDLDFISLDRYIDNLYPMKKTSVNEEIKLLELSKNAP